MPSGDSILVFGVEPGLARFIENKRGKIFCGAGQVHFKSRVGPSGPPAAAGPSGSSVAGQETPDDLEDLIRSVNSVEGSKP